MYICNRYGDCRAVYIYIEREREGHGLAGGGGGARGFGVAAPLLAALLRDR